MKIRLLLILAIIAAVYVAVERTSKAYVISNPLSVEESEIRGRAGSGILDVSIPVRNRSTGGVTVSVKGEVVDLDGKSCGLQDRVAGVRADDTQDLVLSIPLRCDVASDPGNYNLQYELITQAKTITGARSLLPMLIPFSVRVLGGEKFAPGQEASLRVMALRTGSGSAVAGVNVKGSLAADNKSYDLFSGNTGVNGTIPVRFQVPEVPAGSYRLIVRANYQGGEQSLTSQIEVQPQFRIYVTTDKPIYQPSQTIHFRALALSAIQQAPASSYDFTWEVLDPKGNRLFRRELKTDTFGIAASEFPLADEVNLGTYKIRATVRAGSFQQATEKDVTVSRYVLPKFKVELESERNYYQPGETVQGTIDAHYFFGKPVEGTVTLTAAKFDIGFTDFWTDQLTFRDGKASFTFVLPASFAGTPLEQGNAYVELKAVVEDSASQEVESTKKLTVTQSPIVLAAIPASLKLIEGVENRLLVATQYPDGAPAQTQVRFAGLSVATNDSGIAVLKFVPRKGADTTVTVQDAAGKKASKVLEFDTAGQGIILTPSRGFYRVGDSFDVQIFSNVSRTVYVDFIKNNQTLKTEAIDLDNDRGSLRADLSPDFTGSVLVNAYSISRDGEIYRDSKWIVVEPAQDLNIQVKPDRDVYAPGAGGKLHFTVTDRTGKGVAAALGVAIVDEAVFSVSELRPGLEKIYFLLEEELQKPRYEIHALSFEPILQQRNVDQVQAEAALANTARDFNYGVSLDSYSDSARAFVSKYQQKIVDKYSDKLDAFNQALQKYYDRYKSYPSPATGVKDLVDKHFLKTEETLDPWGETLQFKSDAPNVSPWNYSLLSSGPDEIAGTEDDITISPQAMVKFGRADLAGGGMVMKPMMAQAPMEKMMQPTDLPAAPGAAAEPRVREYFPETLLFEPAVITTPDGQADLDVPLADSITDWRVSVTGSSATGALGSTTTSVRVFQDFFVDLDLPVALTRGDEVSVPVAVYNYLKQTQTIRLELPPSDWFASLEPASRTLTVEPGQVTSAYFRIRADRTGKQKLLVKAFGSKLNDAVQREVLVEPNGRKVEATVNGRLAADTGAEIQIPEDAVEGSRQLLLKVYPGAFNQLVEGLDAILQMPYGCFEQTSSTTYPNVLALQYMKSTGKATPEIRMKAEGFINLGYQRLVTFEVNGGGFSWFGQAPAHKILTAYGLLEFSDMSKVYDVDEQLIRRTSEWLAGQQQQDGSWKADEGGIAEGAINRYQSDLVRITAYIGWSLAHSGTARGAVDRAASYVRAHYASTTDPYGLAVAANFLLERDPSDLTAREVLKKLFALRVEDGETISWKQEEPTAVYSEGPSAQVETTALAALAYLKDPEYGAAVGKMLTFLVKQKDPRGTWYSTQATIWALKAFTEALGGHRQPADAVVDVMINGKSSPQILLNNGNSDIVQTINLTAMSVAGMNRLQLKMKGQAQALFALVAVYAMPWKPERSEALEITVVYDKTSLDVDDTARADVTIRSRLEQDAEMVIVDLGIPPGFRIATADLDALVEKGTIEKYSLTGRQAILYFTKIAARSTLEFSVHFRAKFPIKAGSMPVRVYEYYNPQRGHTAPPVEMTVK